MVAAPRVSVVMAAYNAADHIGKAIASLEQQTLHEWELVVVDDCSCDNTRERTRQIARSIGTGDISSGRPCRRQSWSLRRDCRQGHLSSLFLLRRLFAADDTAPCRQRRAAAPRRTWPSETVYPQEFLARIRSFLPRGDQAGRRFLLFVLAAGEDKKRRAAQ